MKTFLVLSSLLTLMGCASTQTVPRLPASEEGLTEAIQSVQMSSDGIVNYLIPTRDGNVVSKRVSHDPRNPEIVNHVYMRGCQVPNKIVEPLPGSDEPKRLPLISNSKVVSYLEWGGMPEVGAKGKYRVVAKWADGRTFITYMDRASSLKKNSTNADSGFGTPVKDTFEDSGFVEEKLPSCNWQ